MDWATASFTPWVFLTIVGGVIVFESAFSPMRKRSLNALVGFFLFHLFSRKWVGTVTKNVPEPYLDEVFHIPQAEAYCAGNFTVWDPKLTTPPGLYVFASVFSKFWPGLTCDPAGLRIFINFSLVVLFSYTADCRALVARTWKAPVSFQISTWEGALSNAEIHTAINILLFPPIFFFGGLFYTDVLSTIIVVRMYRLFLERRGAYSNNTSGIVWLYITGLISLTMRQTNIFWVAVFMGGLELVMTIKSNKTALPDNQPQPATWKDMAMMKYIQYSRGYIHDVPLRQAGVHDFVLCAISIVIAAAHQPLQIIPRLWPYIALLISFAGFVFWNGGVVLGDKSNHVATIHLPQMLYIWPLIAFFSFPLLIPPTLSWLSNLLVLLRLPNFPRLKTTFLRVYFYITISLLTTLVIIHINTIIHPFTLADNRHYMFYIFRYSILRHPLIKYALAPIYLICAYLVYITLIGPAPQTKIVDPEKFETRDAKVTRQLTANATGGPTTSFVLILLITTALSLITAPLVEPRYFIIPWVIWRLNVPPLATSSSSPSKELQKVKKVKKDDENKAEKREPEKGEESYDYRLVLETLWFLAINAVTTYVFIYKGFEWPQEPGKVQRFMW